MPISGTSARYWRFQVTSWTNYPSIGELHFAKLGGAMPTVSASISSSDLGGTLIASHAFDNDLTTAWAPSSATAGEWVGVDFGSAQEINVVRLRGRDGFGQFPTAGNVQYSSDNSTWTTAWSISGLTDTGADKNVMQTNELCSFADPNKTGTNKCFWRVYTTAHSDDATTFCELRFSRLAGGSNDLSSAILYASNTINGTNTVSQTIDANTATFWASTTTPVAFFAEFTDNYNIIEYGITPRNSSGSPFQYPTTFKLQSSPDGVTWTDEDSQTSLTTGWTASVERVFTFGTSGSTLTGSIYTETNTFGSSSIGVITALVAAVYNSSNSFGSTTRLDTSFNVSTTTYMNFTNFYRPTFTLGIHPAGLGSPGRNLVQRQRQRLRPVDIQTFSTNGNNVFRYY